MRYFVLIAVCTSLLVAGCENGGLSDEESLIISEVRPAQVFGGQQNVEGRIIGSGFTGPLAVDMGSGIDIESTKILDPTEIAVVFSVLSDALPGPRTVKIGTGKGVFSNDSVFAVSNNQPPVATFSVSPAKAAKDTSITLDGTSSSDADGTVESHEWDFGDNQKGNGSVVTHKYSSAGTFTIKLTVKDDRGGQASAVHSIEIENNSPPVARFSISQKKGTTATPFRFDASESTDKEGKIQEYAWDFGDGSTGTGRVVTHQYHQRNLFSVTLTVTDTDGLQGSGIKTVEVQGLRPVASFTITPGTGDSNTLFQFDASGSSDPEGEITSYSWDIEGQALSGVVVSSKFPTQGRHSVQLTVTDSDTQSDVLRKSFDVGADLNTNCPAPAQLIGDSCCYGNKCCSGPPLEKGSLGWCSGRLMCTAGLSGYQPALPGFDTYPGKPCSEFP